MNRLKKPLALLLALCLLAAVTACGGGAKTMSREEYEDAVVRLGEDFTAIQNEAASLDMSDVDGAVKLLEEAKTPLRDFIALTPPDDYAGAHARLSSGSQAMVDYIDIVIAMVNETDVNKIQEQAQQMLEYIQTAARDLAEGVVLLEEAAG